MAAPLLNIGVEKVILSLLGVTIFSLALAPRTQQNLGRDVRMNSILEDTS